MINISLIILVVMCTYSCQQRGKVPATPYNLDDYVLIEFAARLEETYPKLYPEETRK